MILVCDECGSSHVYGRGIPQIEEKTTCPSCGFSKRTLYWSWSLRSSRIYKSIKKNK